MDVKIEEKESEMVFPPIQLNTSVMMGGGDFSNFKPIFTLNPIMQKNLPGFGSFPKSSETFEDKAMRATGDDEEEEEDE